MCYLRVLPWVSSPEGQKGQRSGGSKTPGHLGDWWYQMYLQVLSDLWAVRELLSTVHEEVTHGSPTPGREVLCKLLGTRVTSLNLYFPGKMIASARGGWHANGKHRTGAYSGGGTRGRQGPCIVLADVYMGMTCAGLCSGFSQNHRYRNTSILEFISKNSSYPHAPTHPASSTEALPVISERWKQADH